MTSSAKKKKDKKKDFQKPKLKVGKARPKAENSTNTNFQAKAIVLNQQLSTTAPTQETQVLHHVSLLASKSESQRKESLSYLATTIDRDFYQRNLPLPLDSFLEKCMPLILDANPGVRSQLCKVIDVLLLNQSTGDHVAKMLPYIRAAMTHLSSDIRRTALDVTASLLGAVGQALVSSPGGWVKLLECFATLLNWRSSDPNDSWSISKTTFRNDSKAIARALQVADLLLQQGLLEQVHKDESVTSKEADFPLCDFSQHKISTRSNPYSYLHLFGKPQDDDSQMYEDTSSRLLIFNLRFKPAFVVGLDGAKKEGGEVGRFAGQLSKTMNATSTDD